MSSLIFPTLDSLWAGTEAAHEQVPFFSIYMALVILALNAILNDQSPVLGSSGLSRVLRVSPYVCFADTIWKLLDSATSRSKKSGPLEGGKSKNTPSMAVTHEATATSILRRCIALLAVTQLLKVSFYRGVPITQLVSAIYAAHWTLSCLTNPKTRFNEVPAKPMLRRLDLVLSHSILIFLVCMPYYIQGHDLMDQIKTCLPSVGLVGITLWGRASNAPNNVAMQTIELFASILGFASLCGLILMRGALGSLQNDSIVWPMLALISGTAAIMNVHLLGGITHPVLAVLYSLTLGLVAAVAGRLQMDSIGHMSERPAWTWVLI